MTRTPIASRSSSSAEAGPTSRGFDPLLSRLRRLCLALTWGFLFAHSYLWYVSGVRPFGKVAMIGAVQLFTGAVNAATVFLVLAFVSVLFEGRAFCGWLCHMRGAIELTWWLQKKLGIAARPRRRWIPGHLSLRMCALFALLGPLVLILFGAKPWGMGRGVEAPLEGFPGAGGQLFAASAPWRIPVQGSEGLLIVGATFLVLVLSISAGMNLLYGEAAFCRLLCPYSVMFMPLMNRLRAQAKITRVRACSGCQACSRACPQGIHVAQELYLRGGKIPHLECVKCRVCIDVCAEGTLADTSLPPVPQFRALPWLEPKEEAEELSDPLGAEERFVPAGELASLVVTVVFGMQAARLGSFFFFSGCVLGLWTSRRVFPIAWRFVRSLTRFRGSPPRGV